MNAADEATREAHKLNRQPGRLPRPSEINRLPGTGRSGGDIYSYTVVVRLVNRTTGAEVKTTHVVRDANIISGEEVAAAVIDAVGRGDITPRSGTNPPKVGGWHVRDVQIISLYRGSPEV